MPFISLKTFTSVQFRWMTFTFTHNNIFFTYTRVGLLGTLTLAITKNGPPSDNPQRPFDPK